RSLERPRLEVDRSGATFEEAGRVDVHADLRQLGERLEEAAQTGLPGHLAGDDGVRAVTEDLRDLTRQHPTGAGLDEDAHAGGVHRLDLVDPAHTFRDLGGEQGTYGSGVVARVGLGGGVRPDREGRRGHL